MTYRYGIEIECEVNNPAFDIGDYHSGEPLGNYWRAEEDSSLSRTKSGYTSVEFVSSVFTRVETDKMFDRLQDEINDTENMRTMYINRTCGAHIHFSNPKLKPYAINHKTLLRLRNMFFKRLRKEVPNCASSIIGMYDRNYAKQPYDEYNMFETRYQEIHYDQRTHSYEWRSMNLQGCRTWSDMKKVVGIALSCIEKVMDSEMAKDKPFLFVERVANEKRTRIRNEMIVMEVI